MKQPRVKEVRVADGDYSLNVTWEDGSQDIVDLSDPVGRLKVFAPLREGNLFSRVQVADFGWAIGWSGAIDYSADSLWHLARDKGI